MRKIICAVFVIALTAGCTENNYQAESPTIEFARSLAKANRYDAAISRYEQVLAADKNNPTLQLEYLLVRRAQHELDSLVNWALPAGTPKYAQVRWEFQPDFDDTSLRLATLIKMGELSDEDETIAITNLLRLASNEADVTWVGLSETQVERCEKDIECKIQYARYLSLSVGDNTKLARLLNDVESDWRHSLYLLKLQSTSFTEYSESLGAIINAAKDQHADPWMVRQLSVYRRMLNSRNEIAQL